jgi:hypothetical protein
MIDQQAIVLSEVCEEDRKGVIVGSEGDAAGVATFLIVNRSAWVEVTPLPDNQYRVLYKPENHNAVLARFGRSVDHPDQKPWSLERELTAQGVVEETRNKGGVEIHAGGFCLGVWVDHEYDGFSPRMARMIHRANCFGPLLEAAEELLSNARDNGECLVDKEAEKYDPENPEQMWSDWAALADAVAKWRGVAL